VLPVMAGFYLVGVAADNEKARDAGILGGEALIDALVVSQVLKLASGRNRPNAPRQPGNFSRAEPVALPDVLWKAGPWRQYSPMNTETRDTYRGWRTGWRPSSVLHGSLRVSTMPRTLAE
jgi:hypothetical protein